MGCPRSSHNEAIAWWHCFPREKQSCLVHFLNHAKNHCDTPVKSVHKQILINQNGSFLNHVVLCNIFTYNHPNVRFLDLNQKEEQKENNEVIADMFLSIISFQGQILVAKK